MALPIKEWLVYLPVGVMAASWWLPWESLPALLLGPILLLVSIALVMLGSNGWMVALYLVFGVGLTGYGIWARSAMRPPPRE